MLAGAAAHAAPAPATPAAVTIDIPEQGADAALRRLVELTGFDLLYAPELLRGLKTSAVHGRMNAREALARMLKDTGLEVIDTGPNAAALRRRAPPPVAAPSPAPDPMAVIVTARKASESMFDVPIAITALTEPALQRRGAASVADVLPEAPGVSVYARSGLSRISIRGIATSLGGNANGFYLDDFPFSGLTVPLMPDVRAWDVQRIEVLRGPQGTLFGEGAMGGVVRTLTNPADVDGFAFATQAGWSRTEGGGANQARKAMLNVPLQPGVLAVRLAATDERSAGWLDASDGASKGLNPGAVRTGRLRLQFQPVRALSLNASYGRYRSGLPFRDAVTDGGTAGASLDFGTTPVYTLKGIGGNYDLAGWSVFYSYADSRVALHQAGSYSGDQFDDRIAIGTTTHELRLASAAGAPLQWTLGWYRRRSDRHSDTRFQAAASDRDSATASRALAAFGELSYPLPTLPMTLSLGLRHFRDRLTGRDIIGGIALPARAALFVSNNPRLAISYRPAAGQQWYASASKGYRSGQLQVAGLAALAAQHNIILPAEIKPDTIWTYEAGGKWRLPAVRLGIELAVYHSDWNDVAVRIPLGASGFNGLINSKGTRTNGIDLSVTYAATPALSATLAGGLVDARYAARVPGTGIGRGSRVDDVPRLTLSAGAEYRFALRDGWRALARAGLQHAGPHPVSANPGDADGDPVNNLRARFAFSKGNWTVALYGENLLNERGAAGYRTGARLNDTTLEWSAPRLTPRTAGIELLYAGGR